jgi:hypothetical protein
MMTDLYLLRRQYSQAYYTVRSNKNVPSIAAFTCKNKARQFLHVVKHVEHHKQPLVIEEVPRQFIMNICEITSLSVSVFEYGRTDDGDTMIRSRTLEAIEKNLEEAKVYFENKYKYFS